MDPFFVYWGGNLLELNSSLNVSYPWWERLGLHVPGLYAAASVGAGRRYSPQPDRPRVRVGLGSLGRGRPRACTGK